LVVATAALFPLGVPVWDLPNAPLPNPLPHPMSLQIPKFNMNFVHTTHMLKVNQNSISMCFVEEMQF